MSTNKQRISNDINKLITNINKNADENFKQQMRNHAHNVLSSLMGRISRNADNDDPHYWKNQILNKVEKTYDSKSILQCQQACNRVINSSAITKKAQVLRMLFQLSKNTQKIGQNMDDIFTKAPNNLSATQYHANKSNTWNPKENLSQTQMTYNNQSYQNVSHVSNSNIPKQLKQIRFRGSITSGISEDQILKQITFRLQNIKSELIMVDNQGYSALRPTIDVSDTVRRIVRQLSQIGWLYGKVMDQGQDGGPVKKALKLAVRQQMSQYYRWLAVIQNMIKNGQLSLRKLVLWAYEPFQKIKWLAIVLEAAKPFEGCQIISIINSYRPQGSNSINQLLNRLIHHLLQPLFQYIYNWVYRGQLTDTQNQFFIKQSKQTTIVNSQWKQWMNKFELDVLKIPNVLDYDSAVQIFNAGKTLYFLKNRCNEDYHLEIPYFDSKSILIDQINESTTILSPAFKLWLKSISDQLNKELVKVMYDKFLLKKHLNAIKMFYLTGKGDFIQKLMDSLHNVLIQPKHMIHQYELDGYIAEAVNQSFTNLKGKDKQQFKQEITDRLLAKKVQNGPDGWDVFNFDYHVTDPVNTVISPQCIISYQKIFHFLWKVKRVEQSLKQVWLKSIKQFHGAKIPVLHQCQLLRQSMTHFVNNLYGYLMISIESAWNDFCNNINTTCSLDGILQNHKKLVEQLVQITLCNNKSKSASVSLNSIFATIIKFTLIQDRLTNNFSDYYEKRRVYLNRKSLIQKGLQFEDQLQPPSLNLQRLDDEIYQIKEMYQKTFDRFFSQLKKQSNSDHRVSTLCFRLDFSGFYSKIEYNI